MECATQCGERPQIGDNYRRVIRVVSVTTDSWLTDPTASPIVWHMPPPDLFPLVDKLVPGGLPKFLADAEAAGQSSETIARNLHARFDVSVSGETIRRWRKRADALPVPAGDAP